MASTMKFSVVTPEAQVVDVEASDIFLPAHDGGMEILSGHAPLLSNLGIGLLKYCDASNNERTIFIDSGFGHVVNNEVTILTREAILPGDISTQEAQQALTDAEALPSSNTEEVNTRNQAIQRAQQLITLTNTN